MPSRWKPMHEMCAPLMMTIITCEVSISLFYSFPVRLVLSERKREKRSKRRSRLEGDAVRHQVGKSRSSLRKIRRERKKGLVSICHPIRGLGHLSVSLICRPPIQSEHSGRIQRQASRLSLWICLFILTAGSLPEHGDSCFKLILRYK